MLLDLVRENETIRHLLFLASAVLVAWLPAIKGKFVSDDIDGVSKFSDRYDSTLDAVVDSYDYEITKNGKKYTTKYRFRQFNPHLPFPGNIVRWARLNLGAKFAIIGKNKKGHDLYGYVQSPEKHHLINIFLHLANTVLAYFFLCHITSSDIAFFAVLLFSVHPVGNQAVAWCSGIGYLLALTGMLVALNAAVTMHPAALLGVGIGVLISSIGMLAGVSTWIILAFLGLKGAAAIALIVGAACLWIIGRFTVSVRSTEFKKQNMGLSTRFHPRKIFVMVKTIYYYVKLILFPKRLGLFHVWGYHYEPPIEQPNGMFLKGLAVLDVLLAAMLYAPFEIQFGVVWFFATIFIFTNFITAQQFVADRYAFIPSFGFCLIVAFLLRGFPEVFFLVFGIALMRTWAHIPTYDNEIKFYQSNIWNFPDSEVAHGNLGVIYANAGLPGAAYDTWFLATHINPFYDVPLFNMYSMHRSRGNLKEGREFLVRCLSSKIVHFAEVWQKELDSLDMNIAIKNKFEDFNARMNVAFNAGQYDEVIKIRKQLEEFQNSLNPAPVPKPPDA